MDFDGDGVADATGTVVTHTFASGTYNVVLTVRDPEGLEDETAQEVSTRASYPAYHQTSGFYWAPEHGSYRDVALAGGYTISLPSGVTRPDTWGCFSPAVAGVNHETRWFYANADEAGEILYRAEVEYYVYDPSDVGKRVGATHGSFMGHGVVGYGACAEDDFNGHVEFRLLSFDRVFPE